MQIHQARIGIGFPEALSQPSLYGVTPHDPRVFMSTAALLLVVAIAACLVPTWRATRADPMEVLRAD